MSCPDEDALLGFVDGALSAEEAGLVEAHLDTCARCREALSELGRGGGAPTPTEETTAASEDAGAGAEGGAAVELFAGDVVGRYRIVGEIGAGGMGRVYAARDPRLRRRVALKILRGEQLSSSGGTSGRARLLREARALARLNHPHVVSVYDAGIFGQQVYVAMELVDGVTLGPWLREHPRTWREILDVFLAAGRGLAAAHDSGLVHRDFKPGNVLIGKRGEVKVADFGLALPAESSSDLPVSTPGETVETPRALTRLTRSGAVLGTPAYMAPEQMRAQSADARTDQFSYCVALYEALYGERPFTGSTVGELSAAAETGRVRDAPTGSDVPGWVRKALLRGLAPDREARFPSMRELLDALSRDPTARRRRRLAAAAVVLLLGGAIAGSQALVALRNRVCQGGEEKLHGVWDPVRRAKGEAAFRRLGKPWATESWRRAATVLDDYARRWVAMHTEACEATRVRGEQSADLLDRRMWCLGERLLRVRALTDLFLRADLQVARDAVPAVAGLPSLTPCADVRALKARAALPTDPRQRSRIEDLRARLARVEATQRAGKYRQALGLARREVGAARALGHKPTLAEALLLLGTTAGDAGEPKLAVKHLSEASAAAWAGRRDLLAVRAAVGLSRVLAVSEKRFAEAERWARQAGAGVERVGRRPEIAAAVENAWGALYREQGKLRDSRKHLEEGLRLTLGRKPPVPLAVADAEVALGTVLLAARELGPALERFQRGLGLRQATLGTEHPLVAQSLGQVAVTYQRMGKYREALPVQRRALEILEATMGEANTEVAHAASSLALTLQRLGRYAEAVRLRRRALAITEGKLGPRHASVAARLNELGQTLVKTGAFPEAEKLHRRALRIFLEVVGAGDFRVARTRSDIGVTLRGQGRHREAVQLYRQALAGYEQVYGPEHPLVGDTLGNLGVALQMSGQRTAAIQVLRRSLRIYERKLGREHPMVAFTLTHLGTAHYLLRRYDEALAYFRRARDIRIKALGRNHPLVAWLLTNEGITYQRLRQWAKSARSLERARAILEKGERDPGHLAKVRFYLGVALWQGGKARRRARRLAVSAERFYARTGRKPKRLKRIRAWLRDHPLR